ncbi:hypothetical protein IIW_02380 [Bacillus cereus VD136]|nr:hypothetical protein IIW_02380 [Bacillus cereus VD136]
MALQHEFVFVSNEKGELSSEDFSWHDREFFYKDGMVVEECVIFSDEIVLYVSDFLQWIPTYNPFKKEKGFGIHYWYYKNRERGSRNSDQPISLISQSLFIGT